MENSSYYWGFPKGRINSGETPEEAAVRELREETNINLQIDQLGPMIHSRDGIFYYVNLQEYPLIRTCAKEILAFHWANLDHLRIQSTSILTKSVASKIKSLGKKLINSGINNKKAELNGQKESNKRANKGKLAGKTGEKKPEFISKGECIYSKQDCRYY